MQRPLLMSSERSDPGCGRLVNTRCCEHFPQAGGVPRVGSFRKLGIALTPGPLPGSESLSADGSRGGAGGGGPARCAHAWTLLGRLCRVQDRRGVSGSLPWPVDHGRSKIMVLG
jgi:hypothetical protein